MKPDQPPPPPPDEHGAPPLPPPPPPPPAEPDRSSPPPPPPATPATSDRAQPQRQSPSASTSSSDPGVGTSERPRRKRRFSPSYQDPTPSISSQTAASRDAAKPLAADRRPGASSLSKPAAAEKPLTANEWEKTAFVGDASGEKRKKFLRLMGLGKTTTIDAKPESPEEASREAAKRQQQLADMERQYEQGRRARHRFS